MNTAKRRKLQGVTNIIRFNWPLYAIAFTVITLGFSAGFFLTGLPLKFSKAIALIALLTTVTSLFVSMYVYDLSGLYAFAWMDGLVTQPSPLLINIHAGFDESSAFIRNKFPSAELLVYDFYDPAIHTEPSVQRARKLYPADPVTQKISTSAVPVPHRQCSVIFLIFAAHEIRDAGERAAFLKSLGKLLTEDGQVIILEHIRDLPNFLAYNIGFFHFHSRRSWLVNFHQAGLGIVSEEKLNYFVRKFILKPNGTAS